ncbi:hypothetical protein AVEN_201369-1 [Araneus ventricosus]|uniref:Uncharacterized protein n=1 Tax=Araneus ventricosus TaxID=182803 RepID=A0A4Y2R6J7_ARAVE|nr:hypothetical protein AVEN_213774-1 [Araneus ventricosus]GBN71348.1 hypothetical protein AVEN_201369-1 [Araneus ventricosus]
MIGRSKEVDKELSTVPTGSFNCVCVLCLYSTTRCSAGRITTTAINPKRLNAETWALGILTSIRRLFHLFALEKLTIEKEFFFSLPHFLGAQIVFCLRGPLAIGQAGNLASPPLRIHFVSLKLANCLSPRGREPEHLFWMRVENFFAVVCACADSDLFTGLRCRPLISPDFHWSTVCSL